MRVELLGSVVVRVEGNEVAVTSPKERSLLALLALRARHVISVESLVDGLWGEDPPRSAAKTLQTYVSGLRRVLPDGVLETSGGGYRLVLPEGAIDAEAFESLIAQGRRHHAAGEHDGAASVLGAALGLWRGPVLAGLPDTEVLSTAAHRLEELRRGAAELLADVWLAMGRHGAVIAELEAAVAEEPLRERRTSQLMTALYRSGRQADALRAYSRLRTVLGEELGIEPSSELSALERAILQQSRDLDLNLPADRDVVKVAPIGRPAHNLPTQVTRFVGRRLEMADVASLVGSARLVTITGPGGVGKTRLALEVAAGLVDGTGDGVWLVQLAPLSDPGRVPQALSGVLSLREDPGRPILEQVVEFLRHERTLIVLDNCEHVLDACAELADAVLANCPNVSFVATSREPLRVAGEHVYRVGSLALPGRGEDPRLSDAVQLFSDRAALHLPGFALGEGTAATAHSICRHLDGIPLAIELAAARLRSLSLVEIEDRLGNRFRLLTSGHRTALPHQRTLRALIDWSHDLLTGEEQIVLRRISVFAGGFDLRTAEKVISGDDIDPGDAIDLVGSLVDKSLVQVDRDVSPARYSLLETVREYGLERLAGAGADEMEATASAHAKAVLRLVKEAAGQLRGADQVVSLAVLDRETDNIRAAFAHFAAAGDGGAEALNLAASLSDYWRLSGRYRDGLAMARGALDCSVPHASPADRAAVLIALAQAHWQLGDPAAAQDAREEGMRIAVEIDDAGLCAAGLRLLASSEPDAERAIAVCDNALRLATSTGDEWEISHALIFRGQLNFRFGKAEGALADTLDAYGHAESTGAPIALANALNNLGYMESATGDLEAAARHLSKARDVAGNAGAQQLLSIILGSLAAVELQRDRHDSAANLVIESMPLLRHCGQRNAKVGAVLLGAAAAARSGQSRRAAYLYGAEDALRGDVRYDPFEERLRAEDYELLVGDLGEDAFNALLDRGNQIRSFDELAKALEAGHPLVESEERYAPG